MNIASVDPSFFFFKQKTAYEITVRDWSSDVCSSDLDWRPGWPRAPEPKSSRSGRTSRSEERRVGKEVDCCVDLGGRRIIKKKKKKKEKKKEEVVENRIIKKKKKKK